MKKQDIQKLRKQSIQGLREQLNEMILELSKSTLKLRADKLEDTAKIRVLRDYIARIKTIIREKQIKKEVKMK